MKNYQLVQIVGINRGEKKTVIDWDNGEKTEIKNSHYDFFEIENGDYALYNQYGNITAYFGAEPKLKELLYNVEQYELEGERERNGSSRIRKSKRKEIKKIKKEITKQYNQKV